MAMGVCLTVTHCQILCTNDAARLKNFEHVQNSNVTLQPRIARHCIVDHLHGARIKDIVSVFSHVTKIRRHPAISQLGMHFSSNIKLSLNNYVVFHNETHPSVVKHVLPNVSEV